MAHRLRERFPDRWVRFHSLPDSKRYAQNEREYATILDRHNQILGELVGPERLVTLLTTGYSKSANPVRPEPDDPEAVHWRVIPVHELDGEIHPNYWHIFASAKVWERGGFDPWIRLVADDVIRNVMIVDPDCRWLLHPYDGGMDVILESTAARDRLQSLHADWLSRHAGGV